MRITNPMVVRNYTNSIHRNRAAVDRFSRQISSGRSFNTFSEDNSSGIRAMQVRRALARIDHNLNNARSAQAFLQSAESKIMNLNEQAHVVAERFLMGITDTSGAIDRDIILNELIRIRESMLALGNGQFAGRYVFGGTNTVTAPFEGREIAIMVPIGNERGQVNFPNIDLNQDLMTDNQGNAVFERANVIRPGDGENFHIFRQFNDDDTYIDFFRSTRTGQLYQADPANPSMPGTVPVNPADGPHERDLLAVYQRVGIPAVQEVVPAGAAAGAETHRVYTIDGTRVYYDVASSNLYSSPAAGADQFFADPNGGLLRWDGDYVTDSAGRQIFMVGAGIVYRYADGVWHDSAGDVVGFPSGPYAAATLADMVGPAFAIDPATLSPVMTGTYIQARNRSGNPITHHLLYYNGDRVSGMRRGTEQYQRIMGDGAHVDVGINVTFNNEADPTRVDHGSGFRYTLVGLEFLGTGPDNIYDLLTEMINFLRIDFLPGDGPPTSQEGGINHEFGGQLLDRFRSATAHLSVGLASLGADTNFLNFSIERLLDDEINLIERQQALEIRPAEEAILDFKMAEFIYNATLQMGQRLLQPTLFDFIR